MTYNVFSGTLNPTHFTSLHRLSEAQNWAGQRLLWHNSTRRLSYLVWLSSTSVRALNKIKPEVYWAIPTLDNFKHICFGHKLENLIQMTRVGVVHKSAALER